MNNTTEFPSSRSGWADIDWKQSQEILARMLNSYNFMKFEELNLQQGNRADIVVIRSTSDTVIFGIIEVKTYRKINRSLEVNSLKQVCRYLSKLHDSVDDNSRWGNKPKRYFGAVVFTKDYPVSNIENYSYIISDHLSSNLVEADNYEIFLSRPEQLINLLQDRHLCGYSQNSLNDYY